MIILVIYAEISVQAQTIMTQVLRAFPQFLQAYDGIGPELRSRSLSCKFFPINYSLITVSSDSVCSERLPSGLAQRYRSWFVFGRYPARISVRKRGYYEWWFRVYLTPSRQIPEYYLQLTTTTSLPNPSEFLYDRSICRKLLWDLTNAACNMWRSRGLHRNQQSRTELRTEIG